LFCGLGGWTEGLRAAGYRVVGFDNERHQYGEAKYPAQLVIQDVLTLHGSQFKDAALIVASPPCQAYSYRAMPWKKAKALPPPDNTLFEACFRIQREASEAAGRPIPLVVENVRGAQPYVGRAKYHFGSYYLWGDIPALMPKAIRSEKKTDLPPVPIGDLFRSTGIANVCHITGTKQPGIGGLRKERERRRLVSRRCRAAREQEFSAESRLRAHREDTLRLSLTHCDRVAARTASAAHGSAVSHEPRTCKSPR
jgi:hypothetical protein